MISSVFYVTLKLTKYIIRNQISTIKKKKKERTFTWLSLGTAN